MRFYILFPGSARNHLPPWHTINSLASVKRRERPPRIQIFNKRHKFATFRWHVLQKRSKEHVRVILSKAARLFEQDAIGA